MILAAYRNPPYRSPTPRANNSNNNNNPPKASSLSPPPQKQSLDQRSLSPKRKREEPSSSSSSSAPAMLSLATATATAISYEDPVESGANSPRTKVAEKLRGLEVSGGSPRKKVKVADHGGVEATPSVEGREVEALELEIPDSEGRSLLGREEMEMEIGSPTPTPAPLPPHTRRTLSKVPSLRKESSYLSTRASPPSSQTQQQQTQPTSSPPQKRRLSSPPAPSLETMALDPTPLTHDSTTSTSLTWSWSEITGHDIDASNPDDDGEGINGIGFKPTPAMAAARSLKRKKQVEEWKSREAREARQRRIESRRRREMSGGGGFGEEQGGKRVVRFLDA